jgi:hypothetical protein
MQGIVSGSYQQGANALDAILNFQPLLDSLGKILDDYRPATYLIAFILLVVSTMHGFMQTESRRFFHNLVHSIILVALFVRPELSLTGLMKPPKRLPPYRRLARSILAARTSLLNQAKAR